jgi:hypothetical protein
VANAVVGTTNAKPSTPVAIIRLRFIGTSSEGQPPEGSVSRAAAETTT